MIILIHDCHDYGNAEHILFNQCLYFLPASYLTQNICLLNKVKLLHHVDRKLKRDVTLKYGIAESRISIIKRKKNNFL